MCASLYDIEGTSLMMLRKLKRGFLCPRIVSVYFILSTVTGGVANASLADFIREGDQLWAVGVVVHLVASVGA